VELPQDQLLDSHWWPSFIKREVGPAQGTVEVTLAPDEQLALEVSTTTVQHLADLRTPAPDALDAPCIMAVHSDDPAVLAPLARPTDLSRLDLLNRSLPDAALRLQHELSDRTFRGRASREALAE
jgi:hypothetical protein